MAKKKYVHDIKKNDLIQSNNKNGSKVKCVIKHPCQNNKILLVELGEGLKITPWHPIRIGDKFYFPSTLSQEREYNYEYVYNFVLESDHIVKINGVECVTLGHGFKEDVAYHEYLGSDLILNDLSKINGYEEGSIMLKSESFVRDDTTNKIIKLIY